MEAKDKILRAKIQLQKSNPFFSYLLLHLKIVESNDLPFESMGVDNRGNLFYSPKFVDKLSNEQVEAVLCHEVLHKAFLHLDRFEEKERDSLTWNIACDICVNNVLVNNNFSMNIEGCILPQNNEIDVFGKKITDIKNKTAETIYDDLFTHIKKLIKDGKIKKGKGENSRTGKGQYGFDEHIYGKGNKKGEGENGKGEGEQNWKQIVTEAYTMAKNRGLTPLGVDRQIDELLETKLNWRELLYKHITNTIPHDYDFSRPSKKSQACGYYLPRLKREEVEVVVAVDTSGSIGQGELTEFLTEMVGIARAFNNVKMTCLVCDAKIHDVLEFTNGSISEILNTKVRGGGGTAHEPIYEWLDENKPTCRLIINFTDGETSIGEVNYPTLWVISTGGTDRVVKDTGEIIKL